MPVRTPEASETDGSIPDTQLSNLARLHPVLQLQQSIGNRALQRLLGDRDVSIQPKLTVGGADYPYEQEAGRDKSAPTEVSSLVQDVLGSPGQPLEPPLRDEMEQRFSHDFSSVRVHQDAAAAESASHVNALAYTVGDHLVFGQNQYAPSSGEGQELLAHELAHVVQQRSNTHASDETHVLESKSAETEANRAASSVRAGRSVAMSPLPVTSGKVLQRQPPKAEQKPAQNIDQMPMGMYVDAYGSAVYDMDYKSVKGGLSKWIRVSFTFGGTVQIDINIDAISDETETAEQMVQDMFDHVGDGGRVFPKKMNKSTTPQLWEAKKHVLQIMDDYNTLFILGAFPTVWLILTMGIGATGGGRGSSGGRGTIRRPLIRGKTGGGGGSEEPGSEAPGGKAAPKGEPVPETPPGEATGVGGLKAPGPVPKYANGEAVWGQGPEGARQALKNFDRNGLPATGGSRENLQAWKNFYDQAQTAGKGGETAPLRSELMRRILELLDKGPK